MKTLFIAGPTASGKSDLALHLAERFQGQIVNCDSIQCYQKINLGSAKPSLVDLQRCPHHLFDFVAPPEEITAGRYFELAEKTLLDLQMQACPLAIVVGGTGFYLQALEKGMYSVGPVVPEVLARIELELGQGLAEQLWNELNAVDPETAKKIAIKDHFRLGRAIEIWRGHGRTPSAVKAEFRDNQRPFPYPLLKLRLNCEKSWLQERINRRLLQWFRQGWVDEVRELLQQGLEAWAPLQSVGFFEVKQFLQNSGGTGGLGEGGAQKIEDLRALVLMRTLQLAKKQRTWFQRDLQMHDFDAALLEKDLQAAESLVNSWLNVYQ